jgi:addiction module HigA family antidote
MDKKEVARILNGRERRPTHPGELLREDVMPAAGLTQVSLAKALGVSRKTISEVVLEQRPVTVDIAIRLGRFFGNGPALWLNMQQAVDLWDAINANRETYQSIKPLKAKVA